MSLILLDPNRALSLACSPKLSIYELIEEGYALLTEIEGLEKLSVWQYKKGIRLIEIGTLLEKDLFLNAGQSFLIHIGLHL